MAAPVPDALEYLWENLHDMEPDSELGGIYAFKSGYHSTRKDNQNNWPGNYSIQDQVDREGPDNLAAALDWTFPDAQQADYDTIIKYSKRLLDSGKDPDDDRLNWMREFYGQADKDTSVEGWDYRYVRSTSSDSSHLWHIHFSFSRNALTTANMDKLLEVLMGDDMAATAADAKTLLSTDGIVKSQVEAGDDPVADKDFITHKTAIERTRTKLHAVKTDTSDLVADVTAMKVTVDQILAILQSGVPIPGAANLTPESVAAVAVATADEVANRLDD